MYHYQSQFRSQQILSDNQLSPFVVTSLPSSPLKRNWIGKRGKRFLIGFRYFLLLLHFVRFCLVISYVVIGALDFIPKSDGNELTFEDEINFDLFGRLFFPPFNRSRPHQSKSFEQSMKERERFNEQASLIETDLEAGLDAIESESIDDQIDVEFYEDLVKVSDAITSSDSHSIRDSQTFYWFYFVAQLSTICAVFVCVERYWLQALPVCLLLDTVILILCLLLQLHCCHPPPVCFGAVVVFLTSAYNMTEFLLKIRSNG